MDLMCACALRWINYWLHSVLICDHMMHHDESASKCDIDSQDEKEDVSMVLVTPVPASHTNSGHKATAMRFDSWKQMQIRVDVLEERPAARCSISVCQCVTLLLQAGLGWSRS